MTASRSAPTSVTRVRLDEDGRPLEEARAHLVADDAPRLEVVDVVAPVGERRAGLGSDGRRQHVAQEGGSSWRGGELGAALDDERQGDGVLVDRDGRDGAGRQPVPRDAGQPARDRPGAHDVRVGPRPTGVVVGGHRLARQGLHRVRRPDERPALLVLEVLGEQARPPVGLRRRHTSSRRCRARRRARAARVAASVSAVVVRTASRPPERTSRDSRRRSRRTRATTSSSQSGRDQASSAAAAASMAPTSRGASGSARRGAAATAAACAGRDGGGDDAGLLLRDLPHEPGAHQGDDRRAVAGPERRSPTARPTSSATASARERHARTRGSSTVADVAGAREGVGDCRQRREVGGRQRGVGRVGLGIPPPAGSVACQCRPASASQARTSSGQPSRWRSAVR